jgi:hypothetical protein
MDEIKGIARVKFHPGKVEEWKRLTEQAMEIVRTRDTGTLQYEIFFNEDASEALVFERCGGEITVASSFHTASIALGTTIRSSKARRPRTY